MSVTGDRAERARSSSATSSPMTGPLAAFAEADNFIIANFKEAAKAGVKIGNATVPVEILVKDSQSNPNRAAEVAADLILKEKIDLMLVASTPETTNPVSDQCELNEVPCVSTIAPWQPWFFGRGGDPAKGFNWTYHFFWGLEDVIAVFTNLWKSVPTNKSVGGLFPNDGDGNAWGDPNVASRGPLKQNGFTLVDPGRYQNLTADFSAQICGIQDKQSGDPHRRRDSARLQDVLDSVRAAGLQAQSRFHRQGLAVPGLGRGLGRYWVMVFPPKSGGVRAIPSNRL